MKIMYHNLPGLQLVEPGYRKFRIAALMIMGIPSMEGCIETVYGKPGCKIFCQKETYCEDISIPANTSAIIVLPEREETEPGSGKYHFEYAAESSFILQKYNMDPDFGDLIRNPA